MSMLTPEKAQEFDTRLDIRQDSRAAGRTDRKTLGAKPKEKERKKKKKE